MSNQSNSISQEINKVLGDIQTGHFDSLKHFIENHSQVHWTQLKYPKTDDTILHVAARLGLVDIIIYLLNLDSYQFVDCKNRDSKTPLHEAAQFSQYSVIQTLLHYGADVNAIKRADWTPLMLACTKCTSNSDLCVDLLLKNGALVNFHNKDGWAPLHLISRDGNSTVLDRLNTYGININKLTNNGRSALHIAALHGHTSIIQKLMASCLDSNLGDCCGNTPVHEAVLGGHIDMFQYLVKYRGDFTIKNNANLGVLHLAASVGNLPLIEYLVNTINVDVNIANKQNLTPLHCAARKRQREAVNLLIKLGADDKIKDNFGRCANEYFNICH